MKHVYKASLAAMLLVLLSAAGVFAQTTISGKVTDAGGESLPGVSIGVKGLVAGTITDASGDFTITLKSAPPVTLLISSINFKSQEIQVTEANAAALSIKMEEDNNVLPEVAISGGGIFSDETISKSSFAVEKVSLLELQKAPVAEVFDALQHVKGVQFTSGSLNFPAINTRGFATIANTRFVQMVDGMDTSAPLLNFPTGNIVGIGELDLESMELLPGTSSGIYGPNAFNGLLLMNSKSPFDYQGLSAQFKGGFTTSDAQNGEKFPMYNYGIRYAKAFNNKFAFKVNFNVFSGEDWYGTDYRTDVGNPSSPVDLTGTHNFNGLNLYGDDTKLTFPLPVPFNGLAENGKSLEVTRTGFTEAYLIDNYDARSIKGDVALHYRPTDNMEILYNYRYGGGSSVYQGSQKYALRDFTQQFHKLELRSKNWFVRGYVTATDAGDSYNMGALGGLLNEKISETAEKWAPTYVQSWILAMQGYEKYDNGDAVPGGNRTAAHAYARYRADADLRALTPAQLKTYLEEVRTGLFQQGGATFKDNSQLYHAQFNYNFADMIKFAEVMVGGNFRQYSLFSDGTVFNEDPDSPKGQSDFKRIKINEFGVYTQVTKNFSDVLKLIGSLRYDKNENFDGQVTPRISAVYSFGENKNHNFRVSYQTGFRNPDSQSQYIYFPVGTNTLVGSTKSNAERYGIYNGGSWTRKSYEAANGNEDLMVTADIDYIQPEKLNSFDVGYKGTIGTQLFIDVNAYFNSYTNFIGSLDVVSKNPTTHQGETIPAGTVFSPYVNVKDKVKSQGAGVGLTYKIFPTKDYLLTGNYNWAAFSVDNTDYRTNFNTPTNKFVLGFGNRKLTKNLGFNINYRWQEGFLWESDFGSWDVPEFGVVDAQVSYKIASMKTIVKVGGQNIGGGDYRTNFGSAYVGQQYYISLTFDQFYK